jgi:aerobic-type carbon monoxide dehydrogenase small subunit (CoxS/CutS family)
LCVDGVAVLSWSLRVGDVSGEIATIEGLGSPEAMHAAQAAWSSIKFCQPSTQNSHRRRYGAAARQCKRPFRG